MSMVWTVAPAMALKMMTSLGDLMRAVASFAWMADSTRMASSAGWRLEFSLEYHAKEGAIVLLIWPELPPQAEG